MQTSCGRRRARLLPGGISDGAFEFLRAGETEVDRADLEWLCERLVELGAGLYPNEDRSVVDVAKALIRAQLRQDFGAVARAHR
jgi:hypothetical protein